MKSLNPSQRAAVTTTDGPVLVLAGAGSGKTRVIEYRVLHLIREGIDPRSILLLTFTRKAAHEMLARAARRDARSAQVDGGTFHAFCYRQLKRHAKSLGFSESFVILDEADAENAIHRSALQLGLFEKKERFPRKDTLRALFSASVNKNISIATVLDKEFPHFSDYAADIEGLRKKYTGYKISKNYMDYDDLLVYFKLLLEDKRVRERFAETYRYIMVDEYQDTNILQGDIAYLLAEKRRNIMVVGDDAQSIYGFRGASHENIMEFPKRFPECRIITLEENYRSTQSILDVANSVIENMVNKYSKCLVSARQELGEKPRLAFFKDAYEEAEWIADRIKTLRDEGVDLKDQGVLFRAAYISIPLQAELAKRNIPYQVFGGLKFYETAHVKDVTAHLKVIANPRDEIAWERVLTQIKGVGPKTAQEMMGALLPFATIDDMVDKGLAVYAARRAYAPRIVKLRQALKKAAGKNVSVGEKFAAILDYYDPILQGKFDDWPLRKNDLDTLRQITSRYTSLGELLADFAIEPPERGVAAAGAKTPHEEFLTLSTVHSAKGLEWGCVYIIGAIEGIFPISFALRFEDEIEEEHRLFYVALTRAKDRLYLSMHHEGTRGGINTFNRLSRFVEAPNVITKLDMPSDTAFRDNKEICQDPFEEEPALYDKKTLLKKVEEYFFK